MCVRLLHISDEQLADGGGMAQSPVVGLRSQTSAFHRHGHDEVGQVLVT